MTSKNKSLYLIYFNNYLIIIVNRLSNYLARNGLIGDLIMYDIVYVENDGTQCKKNNLPYSIVYLC